MPKIEKKYVSAPTQGKLFPLLSKLPHNDRQLSNQKYNDVITRKLSKISRKCHLCLKIANYDYIYGTIFHKNQNESETPRKLVGSTRKDSMQDQLLSLLSDDSREVELKLQICRNFLRSTSAVYFDKSFHVFSCLLEFPQSHVKVLEIPDYWNLLHECLDERFMGYEAKLCDLVVLNVENYQETSSENCPEYEKFCEKFIERVFSCIDEELLIENCKKLVGVSFDKSLLTYDSKMFHCLSNGLQKTKIGGKIFPWKSEDLACLCAIFENSKYNAGLLKFLRCTLLEPFIEVLKGYPSFEKINEVLMETLERMDGTLSELLTMKARIGWLSAVIRSSAGKVNPTIIVTKLLRDITASGLSEPKQLVGVNDILMKFKASPKKLDNAPSHCWSLDFEPGFSLKEIFKELMTHFKVAKDEMTISGEKLTFYTILMDFEIQIEGKLMTKLLYGALECKQKSFVESSLKSHVKVFQLGKFFVKYLIPALQKMSFQYPDELLDVLQENFSATGLELDLSLQLLGHIFDVPYSIEFITGCCNLINIVAINTKIPVSVNNQDTALLLEVIQSFELLLMKVHNEESLSIQPPSLINIAKSFIALCSYLEIDAKFSENFLSYSVLNVEAASTKGRFIERATSENGEAWISAKLQKLLKKEQSIPDEILVSLEHPKIWSNGCIQKCLLSLVLEYPNENSHDICKKINYALLEPKLVYKFMKKNLSASNYRNFTSLILKDSCEWKMKENYVLGCAKFLLKFEEIHFMLDVIWSALPKENYSDLVNLLAQNEEYFLLLAAFLLKMKTGDQITQEILENLQYCHNFSSEEFIASNLDHTKLPAFKLIYHAKFCESVKKLDLKENTIYQGPADMLKVHILTEIFNRLKSSSLEICIPSYVQFLHGCLESKIERKLVYKLLASTERFIPEIILHVQEMIIKYGCTLENLRVADVLFIKHQMKCKELLQIILLNIGFTPKEEAGKLVLDLLARLTRTSNKMLTPENCSTLWSLLIPKATFSTEYLCLQLNVLSNCFELYPNCTKKVYSVFCLTTVSLFELLLAFVSYRKRKPKKVKIEDSVLRQLQDRKRKSLNDPEKHRSYGISLFAELETSTLEVNPEQIFNCFMWAEKIFLGSKILPSKGQKLCKDVLGAFIIHRELYVVEPQYEEKIDYILNICVKRISNTEAINTLSRKCSPVQKDFFVKYVNKLSE